MSGIPHFEDLPIDTVLEVMDLGWSSTEKLDGSFIKFGLDEEGKYFSQRKGGPRIYDPSDLPQECWTSTYRSGHQIGLMVVDSLQGIDDIRPGDFLTAEILDGELPNAVRYWPGYANAKRFTITSFSFEKTREIVNLFRNFKCSIREERIYSPNGVDRVIDPQTDNWVVEINPDYGFTTKSWWRIDTASNDTKLFLLSWLESVCFIHNVPFTYREILEINLNKKPEKVGNRNWSEIKAEIKVLRQLLNQTYMSHVMKFKDAMNESVLETRPVSSPAVTIPEGIVIKLKSGQLVKFVDRPTFSTRNLFVHRVKYWIVGGRRPAKPSFMSRTKDWPVERRLERLEALRLRYLRHHHKLSYSDLSYKDDLHQRTLNMFCDTRQRIIDGR